MGRPPSRAGKLLIRNRNRHGCRRYLQNYTGGKARYLWAVLKRILSGFLDEQEQYLYRLQGGHLQAEGYKLLQADHILKEGGSIHFQDLQPAV